MAEPRSPNTTPVAPDGPPLIINDGTLPGLVACWAEGVVRPASSRRPSAGGPQLAPVAWFPSDDRPARDRRREAVKRQVDLCSLGGFSDRAALRLDPPAPGHAPQHEALQQGTSQTVMLLAACLEAATLGFSRVIWPIRNGSARDVDIDALATVCDRALLVGQLVGLDVLRVGDGAQAAPARSMRIETPYADLTDAQIMDLALDMDVPLHGAWWCLNEDATPCGHCAACMRWREALASVDPAGRLDIQVLATSSGHGATAIGPLKEA